MLPYTLDVVFDQDMPDLSEFITPSEAAELLDFNINSIYRMIASGKLDGLKFGKKQWLVSKKSVEQYKAEMLGKSKHDPRRSK